MKNILTIASICTFSLLLLSGCTNLPMADQSVQPSPMTEPETTLVPVRPLEPSNTASASQVIDETLSETDQLIEDLQTENFTDLPTTLGQ